MRVLGFSEMWPKLHLELPVEERPDWTTFRFSRHDKDWVVGEVVKIIYQPRRKGGGDYLGIAEIVEKELRDIYGFRSGEGLTDEEALADGFSSRLEMQEWLKQRYPLWRLWNDPMNKLTIGWRERING